MHDSDRVVDEAWTRIYPDNRDRPNYLASEFRELFPSYKRDSSFALYKCFYLYRKSRMAKNKRWLRVSAFEDFYRNDSSSGGIAGFEDLSEDGDFEQPPKMKHNK